MNNKIKVIGSATATLMVTAIIGYAASSCNPKSEVSEQRSEAAIVTNENGSVSRTFTEMTVTTNGNLVTEHRRETRTTTDNDGNLLASTTSEYAQSYPVGENALASLSVSPTSAGDPAANAAEAASGFLGLKFGEKFEGTNFVSDADEPILLQATFTPRQKLAGFDDYYVYVTPKTHRVVKVYACAKAAVESGNSWRHHYLIEALEKRYHTWARPRSWCRPIYTFDLGSSRFVTACLAGASADYETILVAWDDQLMNEAAEETEELRKAARKAAAERRQNRVSAAAAAF